MLQHDDGGTGARISFHTPLIIKRTIALKTGKRAGGKNQVSWKQGDENNKSQWHTHPHTAHLYVLRLCTGNGSGCSAGMLVEAPPPPDVLLLVVLDSCTCPPDTKCSSARCASSGNTNAASYMLVLTSHPPALMALRRSNTYCFNRLFSNCVVGGGVTGGVFCRRKKHGLAVCHHAVHRCFTLYIIIIIIIVYHQSSCPIPPTFLVRC